MRLKIVVWSFVLLIVAACGDDSTTNPLIEAETFEFSATVERFGGFGVFLAHHEPGATLSPANFFWPDTLVGETAGWKMSTSSAHSVGPFLGFGGLHPAGKFALEWQVEWVNGETPKPLAFQPMAAVELGYWEEKGGPSFMKVNAQFTVNRVGPTGYRLELILPSAPVGGGYYLDVVPGITMSCNGEGTKSFILRDLKFSGAGFSLNTIPGGAFVTATCESPLVRYSVVGG